MLLLVLGLMTTAPERGFSEGMTLFDQARFEAAAPLLRDALASGKLGALETKQARLALAQACFYIHDSGCAKIQLQKLLRAKLVVDTRLLPPDFLAFYNATVAEMPAPAAPPRPIKKRPEAHQANSPNDTREELAAKAEPSARPFPASEAQSSPERPPTSQTTSEVASDIAHQPRETLPAWYVRIIPFGVGHFLQGDAVGGALFLSAEVLLLGGNIAFAVVNERRAQPNGKLPPGAQSTGLYWAQQGTAIAAYSVLAVALLDALFWSPQRRPSSAVTFLPTIGPGLSATAAW